MSDPSISNNQRRRLIDKAALTAIYDQYHLPIYRYVYRQVGDVETARDLAADVFRRLLLAVKQGYGPRDNQKAWLYRTAHNLVIDHYRRQKHRNHLPLHEDLVNVDIGLDPDASAELRLSAQQVRAALRHLTPEQQQVITLKYLEGFSNAEVSDIINKSVGAVKSLQHRALDALRRHLVPCEKKVLI